MMRAPQTDAARGIRLDPEDTPPPTRFDQPALWIAPGILAILLSIWFGIDLGPAACCSIHPAASLLLAAGCARILWMMMHSLAGASATWLLVGSVLVLLITGFPPLRQQLQEHAHLLRYRSEWLPTVRDAMAGRFTVDRVGTHEVLYRTRPTAVYFTRDWTGFAKFSWVYCEEQPKEPSGGERQVEWLGGNWWFISWD